MSGGEGGAALGYWVLTEQGRMNARTASIVATLVLIGSVVALYVRRQL